MVRILFLSTSMGMGGAESQLLSAAGVLQGRGHEVVIVSLLPLGPMGVRARSLGFRTESLEMSPGVPDPRGLLRLARLVQEWRPDVVHSHMVPANLLARALRVVAPVPAVVSTIHNIYEGGRLRMAAYRLTNGLVDHMTIVSQAAADRFIREKIVRAPHDGCRLDGRRLEGRSAGSSGLTRRCRRWSRSSTRYHSSRTYSHRWDPSPC